ncbi:integral membrane protein [Candidatus Nitrosopumilus salaria BD31]|uniref:Integral membrane protein n=1 Tax=Candidatus Nitrosopumilus salarius BD31 TaxID=859350 RepID=I3D4X8_9ARCH|nr:VIT1/CCC1 transporter family protein [Candidatus Nitrosopumilus salaria]EIJ66771.1 integral membrane protein [Candidatus Nitrosopumilus salaria BD31]
MKWHFDDFIYGSIDGAVTTFAIVAGVVGAALPAGIILILGFANLFADGFSMAAANYQASKARNEFVQMKRRQEEWEIDNLAEQERDEIREIYREKGFKDELLEDVVRIITSRRKVWVDTMMKEELGLIENERNPMDSSVSTFVGFNIIGIIPLIPFMIFMMMGIDTNSEAFIYSTIFVLAAFFLVGMIKGKIVKKSMMYSGIITLIIGGIAAIVAYMVGYGLNFLVS